MALQYSSDYPPLAIGPSIPEFFETFYQISDTPDAHERYADAFTEDALLIMASKQAKGRKGLFVCFLILYISAVSLSVQSHSFPNPTHPYSFVDRTS